LTCVERAASVSHQIARNIASSFDTNWVLILEDDAIIFEDFFNSLEELISLSLDKYHEPLGYHLFPEQFGILKRKSANLAKILLMPDYAVAYVLNQPALRFAANNSHSCSRELADWPSYMKKISWFAPLQSCVAHPVLSGLFHNSSIETSRSSRQKSWGILFFRNWTKKVILIFTIPFSRKLGDNQISAPDLRSRYL